jgi:hypothetical protein
MKKLISFLLLILSLQCLAQTTSVIKVNDWNAVVTLPDDYAVRTNVNTIIFFPGLGEVGDNVPALRSNGPQAYLDAGGQIVGNPIIISLQPLQAYPVESSINIRLQTLKSLYRIGKIALTGLSHGGWCSSTFVTGDPYGGPYIYATQINCVVTVEGVIPNDNSPYPNLFDNFSKNGGKYLGFEQSLDNRDTKTVVDRMNLTVPNSAVYIQTNFGGGGHCCWSSFYGGQGTQPTYFSQINGTMYEYIFKVFNGSVLAIDTSHGPVQVQQSLKINYSNSVIRFRSTIIATWTVYDATGRAVMKGIYNAASVHIDVSALAHGFYIFKTQDKNGYPVVFKLIK